MTVTARASSTRIASIARTGQPCDPASAGSKLVTLNSLKSANVASATARAAPAISSASESSIEAARP